MSCRTSRCNRGSTGPGSERYVRSYVTLRFAIGVLGLALPFVLVLVEPILFDGQPFPRGSLSAYYYSGMRELFVGVLWAIGVFLVLYKLTEFSWESRLSTVAGFAAVLVALFPTGRPGDGVSLTPLQDLLGEATVETVHFFAAAVFIGSLAPITFFFGREEGEEAGSPGPALRSLLACLPLDVHRRHRGRRRSRVVRGHHRRTRQGAADRRGSRGLGVRRVVADEGRRARHPPRSKLGRAQVGTKLTHI